MGELSKLIPADYERARVDLQEAVIAWMRLGATSDELVEEVEHTIENVSPEMLDAS